METTDLRQLLISMRRRYQDYASPYWRRRVLRANRPDYRAEHPRLTLPGVTPFCMAVIAPWVASLIDGDLVHVDKVPHAVTGDTIERVDLDNVVGDLMDAVGTLTLADDAGPNHVRDFRLLYAHVHNPGCEGQDRHEDRADLHAYLTEALGHLWRALPRHTVTRAPRPRVATPLSAAERKARHLHRVRVEWPTASAVWAVGELADAGKSPASYDAALKAIKGVIADRDAADAEMIEYERKHQQYLADVASWRAASRRRRGVRPQPPVAPETWAEYAEEEGMPVHPVIPTREIYAAVLAETTGATLAPVRTATEIIDRWISGLPPGRHTLPDLWTAWQKAAERIEPGHSAYAAARLGRTQFYAALAEVGTVVSGGKRQRLLVVGAPEQVIEAAVARIGTVERERAAMSADSEPVRAAVEGVAGDGAEARGTPVRADS